MAELYLIHQRRSKSMSKPENPYPVAIFSKSIKYKIRVEGLHDGWQKGFEAALSYLDKPCTKHSITVHTDFTDTEPTKGYQRPWAGKYPEHRYLCGLCRKEIGL